MTDTSKVFLLTAEDIARSIGDVTRKAEVKCVTVTVTSASISCSWIHLSITAASSRRAKWMAFSCDIMAAHYRSRAKPSWRGASRARAVGDRLPTADKPSPAGTARCRHGGARVAWSNNRRPSGNTNLHAAATAMTKMAAAVASSRPFSATTNAWSMLSVGGQRRAASTTGQQPATHQYVTTSTDGWPWHEEPCSHTRPAFTVDISPALYSRIHVEYCPFNFKHLFSFTGSHAAMSTVCKL